VLAKKPISAADEAVLPLRELTRGSVCLFPRGQDHWGNDRRAKTSTEPRRDTQMPPQERWLFPGRAADAWAKAGEGLRTHRDELALGRVNLGADTCTPRASSRAIINV